jgi:hypothetical protein
MPMAKLNLYEFIINTGKTVCLQRKYNELLKKVLGKFSKAPFLC